MNKLKITITAALLMCGTAVFAGTPKTDTKDAKAPAKVEAKTADVSVGEAKTQTTFTYYVTGKEIVNGVLEYTVTTQPQQCSTGADPCKIETDQAADSQSQVPASAITSVLGNQSL